VVNTNASGVATTTLTLTTTATATVTATVGVQSGTGTTATGVAPATVTVTVSAAPTVSVTAPTGTLTTAAPIAFTIIVQPATGSSAQIRDVSVDFGDGSVKALGAVTGTISVQHLYAKVDTFTVRVTASDNLGATTSAATLVVIQAQPPLVSINSAKGSNSLTTIDFTFTANVFPVDTNVVSYVWNFGDGTTTAGTPVITHTFTIGSSPRTVSVTVTIPNGQQATGSISITPQP
jgi:hypothetical protein